MAEVNDFQKPDSEAVDQQQACSAFVALCHEWLGLAAQKWREERAKRGHWVGMEAGFMHAEDRRRRADTSRAVQSWTISWFRERGWKVKIEMHPDGEQFRPLPLHGPNDLAQQPRGESAAPQTH